MRTSRPSTFSYNLLVDGAMPSPRVELRWLRRADSGSGIKRVSQWFRARWLLLRQWVGGISQTPYLVLPRAEPQVGQSLSGRLAQMMIDS